MPRKKNETELNPPLSRVPSNNLIYTLLIIVSVFSLYNFIKIRNLEQKINSGLVQGVQESPLSADNLKKYAKEIGLDTKKFNQCLDGNTKQSIVTADQNYGSSVGIQGTPGFFINGRLLAGAYPFEFFKEVIDKEIAGTATDNCTDYSTDLQKYCSDPDPNNRSFFPEAKKIDGGNSPSIGANNPKITIVEFSDFECPYCIRAFPTVQQVLKTYGNQVRFYYKNFPLTQIHKNAGKAAEATLCAQDQGKFWQYHDKLFTVQSQ